MNLLRGVVTVVSLLVFLGVIAWAWSARNRRRFDEAAALPFLEDRPPSAGDDKSAAGRNE